MYLLRFILLSIDMVNDFLGKNCQYVAGAIAFYTLFSMFPLALAIVSIWGFFSGQEMERAALAEQMAEIIPVKSAFIIETMSGVVSARAITGIVSVAAMIWASSTAFGAIRKGINTAWGVTRTRPFIRERLIDIGLATSAGILIFFLLFVAPMVSSIRNLLQLAFPDVPNEIIGQIVTFGLAPVIAFCTFLVLYRYMPNTKCRLPYRVAWRAGIIGSFLRREPRVHLVRQHLRALQRGVRRHRRDNGAADMGVRLGDHLAVRRAGNVRASFGT